MIGGTYLYRARTVTLAGFAIQDSTVQIRTKGHPIHTTLSKLEETLDELLPVQEPDLPAETRSQMNSLEKTLLDNIEKLKDDPGYLDQAKEINSHANTIVKMNRQKIEMIREIRKHKEG